MDTMNPHMREGELLLKAYLERSLRQARRDLDLIDELNDHPLTSFSSGTVTVRATDMAIYILGTQGENALLRLDAHRGIANVLDGRSPTQHVVIFIEADGDNLVITKPALTRKARSGPTGVGSFRA